MISMLNKIINKSPIFVFWAIIVAQVALIIVLGFIKCNFHQDELFSFESAHYFADSTPGNRYMHQTDIFEEKSWLNVGEFKEFLMVDDSSSVLNDEAPVVCKKLIFDDTYDFLVNIVASVIFPGKITKWVGIIINIPFIVLGQYMLYQLAYSLRNKKSLGWRAVVIYGLSGVSLSFSVYTRFYCFVLSMILVAVSLHYKMWKEKRIFNILLFEIISYFCLFEAFICSELVAIIIVGLYLSYLIGVFARKQWKQVVIHITPIVIGFTFFLKEYLSFFLNILRNPQNYIHEGEPLDLMIKGATNISLKSLIKRIYIYTIYVGDYLFGSILILAVLVVVLGFLIIKNRRKFFAGTKKSDSYIFVIYGVVCIYSIFSIVVALWLPRYYALIYPLIVLIIVCAFDRLFEISSIHFIRIITSIFGIGILLTFGLEHIDNVFVNESKNIQALEVMDADICDHVVWNMEDFQIIMECVYQADVDDRLYVCSEYEDLDYEAFDRDFLLWIGESETLSKETIDIFKDEGFKIEKNIGVIADANIYYVKKIN